MQHLLILSKQALSWFYRVEWAPTGILVLEITHSRILVLFSDFSHVQKATPILFI